MRVVWSFSLLVAACGGRTLGDPVLETAEGGNAEMGGRFGGGASSGGTTGGTSRGGAQTGGVSTSGGVAVGSGGRASSGGAIGVGGAFATGGAPPRGGAPGFGGFGAFGGFGGRIATGGSGGAPVIDKACAQFCDKVQGLCGVPMGETRRCAEGCSGPLVSSSPECQTATRALLDCVNAALSAPVASCQAIGTIALLRCSDQLLKVNSCNTMPPEMCTDTLSGSSLSCERIRGCGGTEYRSTCVAGTNNVLCYCQVNGVATGKMLFSAGNACDLASFLPCP